MRDEDPLRQWDHLGKWWPEQYPDVVGIRDRRAGGAWLAANLKTRRLAVLLNRADTLDLPEAEVLSRGNLVLESAAGRSPLGTPRTHGFNMVEVTPGGARVLSWDGVQLRETPIGDGIHMIAHDDLDDPSTPRIAHWLPRFREHPITMNTEVWSNEWLSLLEESADLASTDDRAIIRDNRPHGYPTLSLLYCVAAIDSAGITLHDKALQRPGHWSPRGGTDSLLN